MVEIVDFIFCCYILVIVQALMDIKESLRDPHGVLDNWDRNAVDPCSWAMVSCSSEDRVISL